MLTVLIYIILPLLIVYYLVKRNNNYWQSRGIIQETPYLFFGNLYDVIVGKQSLIGRIKDVYFKYRNQPYVGFYTFTKPILMVNSPDLIKRILVKDFDKFMNRIATVNEKSDPIVFHSVFFANDTVWRNLRTKLSPVFTSGKMKMMLPLMMECGDNLSTVLKQSNNGIFNVRDLTKRYAVDLIASCAFGVNGNCLMNDNSEIFIVTKRILNPNTFKFRFTSFCTFFAPKISEILRLSLFEAKDVKFYENIFKTTLNEREKLKIQRNDLIDLLNQLRKMETINDEYKFDDIKMIAQALSFFSAGNNTTSLTIAFTLYHLALDKTIQNRLREEIRQSYNKNNGFTYEGIQEMKYLNMVVNETLRMYPLTTFLDRKAVDDYLIQETGYKIEKGTTIMIPTCGLHFDPEYFPNPDKFDPERFNDENKHNIIPYTYLPFGEGPRNCIGQRFGLLATKVALIHAIKDFEFDITDETNIPLKTVPTSIVIEVEDGRIPLKVKAL